MLDASVCGDEQVEFPNDAAEQFAVLQAGEARIRDGENQLVLAKASFQAPRNALIEQNAQRVALLPAREQRWLVPAKQSGSLPGNPPEDVRLPGSRSTPGTAPAYRRTPEFLRAFRDRRGWGSSQPRPKS